MSKIFRKLPQPEGVAAGATATFRIPTGRRIHELVLAYAYDASTQNVSHMSEIRIFANDQVIHRYTGTERDKLNQYDGLEASQGVLVMAFDRKGLRTINGVELTALNTGVADKQGRKISSMYMEIDIAGGATISASDLSLYARESDPILFDNDGEPAGAGTILFVRKQQRNPQGADPDFQISDLINPGVNAPDKLALNRIHFIPSTGSLSNLKVERNGYEVFNRTDALNRTLQVNGVKVPQAGYYSIDTTEQGNGGEVIDLFGMTDFRYKLNASAAMTLTCISEYFGQLVE